MFGLLKKIFSGGNEALDQALAQGALIVDVRTPQEFSSGNVPGSVNIPLQVIGGKLQDIKKKANGKTVVVCCASGMRSGSAKTILAQEGIPVVNGGSWFSVLKAVGK
jgi:rhodanese-related sulfurtransferase